jgi:hypothetical protein
MTIAELIEALQEFNPNTRVLVRGYEGGYDDVAVSEIVPVILNVHREWYYGKHDDPNVVTGEVKEKDKIDAIILKGI